MARRTVDMVGNNDDGYGYGYWAGLSWAVGPGIRRGLPGGGLQLTQLRLVGRTTRRNWARPAQVAVTLDTSRADRPSGVPFAA